MKRAKNTFGFPFRNIFRRKLGFMICWIGIITLFGVGTAMAQAPVLLVPGTQTGESGGPGLETDQLETVRIQAIVKAVEGEQILAESQSEDICQGEIILNTSVFDTRFVNGETGFRADTADLQAGDVIYADIRTITTESLPPQATAEIIICGMPEESTLPEYILTESIEWQEDQNWRLVASSGTIYQIPRDCSVISYGMNELASFRIISKDSKLLIWADEDKQAQRIVKLPARW